jgi:SWI/SNF-related matrix-associated actin-dependent regulator of chromatin subfamily A-like protein 1
MDALPHQITGAKFLADRKTALLADAPRVGKTGAAIIAADYTLAQRILVITTASGRPVWRRGFDTWSRFRLSTGVLTSTTDTETIKCDRVIVGWPTLAGVHERLKREKFDLILVDESHYAKSPSAIRTQALYGGLTETAERVWCLTGTPIPNAPNDLWAMMWALCPERLTEQHGPTDVRTYDDFVARYCITKPKRLSRWNTITVVIGGKNLPELRERLDGFWLRRTQADVGITAPIYEILPVTLTAAQKRKIEAEVDGAEDIIAAAETGETRGLDIQLGTLRRLTGTIKAQGVINAARDEFDCGLDKIVIMAWHKDVMDLLEKGLSQFGVVRVDGSTSADNRVAAQDTFQTGSAKVFIGQIIACGEAIDLSAAAELIFAESSFVPKDMSQAALRITNHGQTRQPRVRVAALEGSIDEALQTVLTRKIATNKEILK